MVGSESGDDAQGSPLRRRRRRIAVVVAVLAVFGTLVALTVYVGHQALVAKESLERAQQELGDIRSGLGHSDADLVGLSDTLQADTTRAAQASSGRVWRMYEHVPWLGPNLRAFRQTAQIVDDLARDGVGPLATAADGLSSDSLKPKDGRIDLTPLRKLAPAMGRIDGAVKSAEVGADGIDTSNVVPQLKAPITRLQAMLEEASKVTGPLGRILPVLYPALGGDGARHYLLIFQNNAEERASGGNPASMAMLELDNGKVTLGRQAGSEDFPHPYAVAPYTPSGPGNEDWNTVYTAHASRYVTNITMTPDFPTTAKMARAMWRNVYGGKVDGVISFDPVALSYLLEATGPVRLSDGHSISSGNAVDYLLYDVYAKYRDPHKQDAVFASAARSIFHALLSGHGELTAYLSAAQHSVAEQRLKMWSVRDDEQRLLIDSPLGNMLPADNGTRTTLGVYNNDDSTSKMSFFMNEKIDVTSNTCQSTPRYDVSAKITNTLKRRDVASLPEYVKPHQARIVPGGDRQWVQIYGPVGARLDAMYVDGVEVVWGTSADNSVNTKKSATGVPDQRPAVKGTMYGRPVGSVSVKLGPSESVTVKAAFSGGDKVSDTVAVSHTPKVREVPVRIQSATC